MERTQRKYTKNLWAFTNPANFLAEVKQGGWEVGKMQAAISKPTIQLGKPFHSSLKNNQRIYLNETTQQKVNNPSTPQTSTNPANFLAEVKFEINKNSSSHS